MFHTAQEILGGALKGGCDATTAYIAHTFGSLVIGLPLQIVLFSTMSSKLAGIWFGLAVGMLCICVFFLVRLSQHDHEMISFNMLKGREEKEKKKETSNSFDKMISYKAPPSKISPQKQSFNKANAIN